MKRDWAGMKPLDSSVTVAGIDIGGCRKGCHRVILRGHEVVCNINSRDAEYLARQCNVNFLGERQSRFSRR